MVSRHTRSKPSMAILIHHYLRERSPIGLIVVLSFVLFFAGLPGPPVDKWAALQGWLSASLLLLLARISDDMADVPIDQMTHPTRFLCQADMSTHRQMRWAQWVLVGLLLILQVPSGYGLLFILAVVAIYGGFFAFKHQFPIIAQTVVVNSTLALFPVYGELLLTDRIGGGGFLMGLFFWLGALAHEYSHSLLETGGEDSTRLNPINRLNQTYLAIGSLILFALSGSVGLLLHGLHYTGPVFLLVLLGCMVVMVYLEIPLIRKPGRATAQPFYWFGYAFFLLPALGHILSTGLSLWGASV